MKTHLPSGRVIRDGVATRETAEITWHNLGPALGHTVKELRINGKEIEFGNYRVDIKHTVTSAEWESKQIVVLPMKIEIVDDVPVVIFSKIQ